MTGTGRSLANEDVRAAASKAELLELVRHRAEEDRPVVHVEGFDESGWDPPDVPTGEELDGISDRPVVVTRADGHLIVVNAAALAAIDPVGAHGIERGVDDEPTGRLRAEANRRASTWVESTYDRLRIEEFQLQAAGLAASRGVTSVHEMSMHHADLEVLLGHRARLPVDVSPIPGSTSLQDAMAHGFPSIGGDLPIDGSIGARTAALVHPYEDGGGDGELYHDDDQLAEFFHTGTTPACRSACTRSGTARSNRCSRPGSACTWPSTPGSDATSAPAAIASSTSSSRRPTRSNAPRCSASRSRCSPFDRQWGQEAVCTRSGWDPRAHGPPDPNDARARDRGRRGLRFADHTSTRWPRSPRWRVITSPPSG